MRSLRGTLRKAYSQFSATSSATSIGARGGKPPIDRCAYEALMECYDFEPFHKHWSRRKKLRALGYMNTIKLYYDTVNTDRQEEMLHQIQRDNNLTLFTGIVN